MTVPAESINSPYGQRITRKTVVFDHTTGTVPLFTVTGLVDASVMFLVTSDVTSEDEGMFMVLFGDVEASYCYGRAPVAAGMASDTWTEEPASLPRWVASAGLSPSALGIHLSSALLYGHDISLDVRDTLTSGTVTFYCLWTPLSTDGDVAAAA